VHARDVLALVAENVEGLLDLMKQVA